ncbi:hypothetical protein AK812_SmicGene43541 [Symbiodinium microadriaticum]|uniref:Uncharacterized protein n=1 Tax=Symbiodinium microadriaticum TaxID=2951 RepID=A0A1Q9C0S1_SYMMI|nr:hypothetical protein AK812_SmicGene43541 [Symbiodinium microadriaticum]
MEGHLDSFDVAVRELMRLLVTEGLGSGTPPLRLVLALEGLSPLALLPQYVHIAEQSPISPVVGFSIPVRCEKDWSQYQATNDNQRRRIADWSVPPVLTVSKFD